MKKPSPVPSVARPLLTVREAIAATTFSAKSLKAARDNGQLIEGVHYHRFMNLIYFDEELIRDWAQYYYANPRRHQQALDRFYAERKIINNAINYHRRKSGNESSGEPCSNTHRNRSGRTSTANGLR
jgi:hypothetical protein